jgi:glycosyltransferase involved in cell wall biosynthesis
LDIPKDAFVFTFIGGVRPNKGVDLLIKAFLRLKNPNYRLMIAGKIFPPELYAQSLIHMAENDDRIKFNLQHIPNNDFQIYLNAADVVVLPFAKILTSGTANLAMSFHRPVIAPNVGCLPELIEPGMGWIFEQGNSDSLLKVMDIASHSDVETAGRRAFEKLAKYSPELFASQTIEAYYR